EVGCRIDAFDGLVVGHQSVFDGAWTLDRGELMDGALGGGKAVGHHFFKSIHVGLGGPNRRLQGLGGGKRGEESERSEYGQAMYVQKGLFIEQGCRSDNTDRLWNAYRNCVGPDVRKSSAGERFGREFGRIRRKRSAITGFLAWNHAD